MTIKPILKYPGAKWMSAEWICSLLPRTPYYIEPYCGSAAVWFTLWGLDRGWPSYAVLNDLEGEIAHVFRMLRTRRRELCEAIALTPWSRSEYESIRDAMHSPSVDEPIERARRYLVQLWQGHGTATGGRSTVGWRHQGPGGMRSNVHTWQGWNKLPARLAMAAQALKDAEIESRPALELIVEYAAPDVLLYVDPPYPGTTRNGSMYRHEMRADADHATLLDALDLHPGPVVLSGYHCALYDDRLRHWHTREKRVQAEKGNIRTEVLWLNQTCIDRLGNGPLFEGI